ncbi:hypothetical protein [Staphylococcus epidermidis]|nr:hypothetical protein [Staphylococcus epidermidis]
MFFGDIFGSSSDGNVGGGCKEGIEEGLNVGMGIYGIGGINED